MASRGRQLAKLLDGGGDVVSDALDNVTAVAAADEVVQTNTSSDDLSSFVVDSVSVNEAKAVTFTVAAFSTSNSAYQFTTLSAINYAGNVAYNEYGTMESLELATYEVRFTSATGLIELVATPKVSGVSFSISRISVESV